MQSSGRLASGCWVVCGSAFLPHLGHHIHPVIGPHRVPSSTHLALEPRGFEDNRKMEIPRRCTKRPDFGGPGRKKKILKLGTFQNRAKVVDSLCGDSSCLVGGFLKTVNWDLKG